MLTITKVMVFGFFLLMLVSIGFSASCASEAYQKSCSSCKFDANGKIDQSCSRGYQSSGTACVSASYPIAAAKYAQGKCPAIDDCATELRTCQAQYSSGNDKADCQEGSVSVCYSAADQCVSRAATKCGEIESQCPGSSAVILLPFLGLGVIWIRNKKEEKK